MRGDCIEIWASRRIGWIDGVVPGEYSWSGSKYRVVILPNIQSWNHQSDSIEYVPIDTVSLLAKGDGKRPVPGLTYPFLPVQLRDIAYFEWDWLMRHTDHRHNGFDNLATHLAWLYLNNESKALQAVRRQYRKDGSVNPNKVAKIFKEHGLKIDDWALEPQIDPPAGIRVWDKHRPHVNWEQVAYEFRKD